MFIMNVNYLLIKFELTQIIDSWLFYEELLIPLPLLIAQALKAKFGKPLYYILITTFSFTDNKKKYLYA